MLQSKLRVRQISQEETAWCWAAAAEMVFRYYDKDIHQCELAKYVFNRNDCCGSSVPDGCNAGVTVRDIRRVYQNWQVSATLESGPVSFPKLKDEIDAERPVEVAFTIQDGSEHAVIVRGYREDRNGEFVIFNDPDPFREIGDLSLQDFTTAEGKGSWWRTWTEIAP